MSSRIGFLYGDFTHEAVYLAVDRNRDGDVADVGEITVFFDESNASDLAAPTGTVLDLVQASDGSVFYGDNPTDSVYRLIDRNGDGDAQDAREAKVWFSAAGNAASFVMPTPNGVSVGADGAVYIVNAGVVSGPVDDVVYRTVDRNRDGDAQDAGEADVWLDLQTLNPPRRPSRSRSPARSPTSPTPTAAPPMRSTAPSTATAAAASRRTRLSPSSPTTAR